MMKIYSSVVICLVIFTEVRAFAQNLDVMIRFMKENPRKASIHLIENGKTKLTYNGDQLMPLASAAKTIIAIEFAKQSSSGKIDPAKKIPVAALSNYYILNTDGNAHPNWLKSLKLGETDSVQLLDIAKGMIRFSSNANTEFLQDYLGMASINKTLSTLKLKNHQPMFYFTAGALLASLKPKALSLEEWLARLKAMPVEKFRQRADSMHSELKGSKDVARSFEFARMPLVLQRIWSDRLVSASATDYAVLMQKINTRTFFDSGTQAVLESIMEWPMIYEGNRADFIHLGQKGGSTSFVLTDAFFAQRRDGTNLSAAFLFNDLTVAEQRMISSNFGNFEAALLTDKKFRDELAIALK